MLNRIIFQAFWMNERFCWLERLFIYLFFFLAQKQFAETVCVCLVVRFCQHHGVFQIFSHSPLDLWNGFSRLSNRLLLWFRRTISFPGLMAPLSSQIKFGDNRFNSFQLLSFFCCAIAPVMVVQWLWHLPLTWTITVRVPGGENQSQWFVQW